MLNDEGGRGEELSTSAKLFVQYSLFILFINKHNIEPIDVLYSIRAKCH